MTWKIDFGDREWHSWFAWYPVRLSYKESDSMVWWERVEREKQNVQGWIVTHYRRIS